MTVNIDGTANLSIVASVSSDILSYQWYSNTSKTNTGGTLISGAESSIYSVPTSDLTQLDFNDILYPNILGGGCSYEEKVQRDPYERRSDICA